MLVALTLTPDDFLEGSPCNPHGCPTYLAIKRLTLPGIKVIVQPENALIYDPINPVMHTVQFPEEMVRVIQRHDDHTTVLLEPETFQIDIPQEVLRNAGQAPTEIEEEFEGFENEVEAAFAGNDNSWVSDEDFARSLRDAFKDFYAAPEEYRECDFGNKKAA